MPRNTHSRSLSPTGRQQPRSSPREDYYARDHHHHRHDDRYYNDRSRSGNHHHDGYHKRQRRRSRSPDEYYYETRDRGKRIRQRERDEEDELRRERRGRGGDDDNSRSLRLESDGCGRQQRSSSSHHAVSHSYRERHSTLTVKRYEADASSVAVAVAKYEEEEREEDLRSTYRSRREKQKQVWDARRQCYVAVTTAAAQERKKPVPMIVAEPNPHFVPLPREWVQALPAKHTPVDQASGAIDTGSAHVHQGSGTRFTVFTYNCLAPSLVSQNTEIYRSHKRAHGEKLLKFSARGPNLLADIIAANGDILCLQEVDECHFGSFWEPGLAKHGYKGTYLRCTGTKTDGSAILVKTSIMTMVDFQHVQFSPDRDNVGVVAMIKIKALDRLICVATTHFLWNPKAGMFKLNQILKLMTRAKEMIEDYEAKTKTDIMLILAGDFNLIPGSFLHELLVAGEADMAGVEPRLMSGQGLRGGRKGLLPLVTFQQPIRAVANQPRPVIPLITPAMSLGTAWTADPAAVVVARTSFNGKPLGGMPGFAGWEQNSAKLKMPAAPHEQIIRHPFNLTSVYAPYYDQANPAHEPYFSSWHDAAHELVDYILYGRIKPDARERPPGNRSKPTVAATPIMDLECMRYLRPPAVRETSTMPNLRAPSDHVYLMAEFEARLRVPA
ncbi:Endonuclease/exonuclease/phosphatase [Geranomyces variabilis]|nr:Endonuclease/exonuclease/phosphatase [Geranomyces variabilis]KAJ3136430.1 Protein angel 2 [Geranomyces variabilis]